jgi:hypothetical protein
MRDMLEEVFVFITKGAAWAFASEMKKGGCRVNIETVSECISEDQIQTKISTLRSLRERIRTEEDRTQFDIMIERLQTDIERFFGGAEIGALIPDISPDMTKESLQCEDLEVGDDESKFLTKFQDVIKFIMAKMYLIDGGMLRSEPDGCRVIEEIDFEQLFIEIPDSIYNTLTTDELGDLPRRSLSKHQIKPLWHVITSPELYFSELIRDLEERLEEYDFSEREISTLFDNIRVKEDIILEITNILRQKGFASLEELLTRCSFSERSYMRGETKVFEQREYDPVIITGIIEDMKKVRIIRGKSERLRLA